MKTPDIQPSWIKSRSTENEFEDVDFVDSMEAFILNTKAELAALSDSISEHGSERHARIAMKLELQMDEAIKLIEWWWSSKRKDNLEAVS